MLGNTAVLYAPFFVCVANARGDARVDHGGGDDGFDDHGHDGDSGIPADDYGNLGRCSVGGKEGGR